MKLPSDMVHLQLTLPQCAVLLEALVEQPFKRVFELIGLINQQIQPFYSGRNPNIPIAIQLHRLQVSLCVKSLAERPYNRVAALLEELQRQLLAQVVQTNANMAGSPSDD
jgi:hypothetical protein